jgi:hypothetical protein
LLTASGVPILLGTGQAGTTDPCTDAGLGADTIGNHVCLDAQTVKTLHEEHSLTGGEAHEAAGMTFINFTIEGHGQWAVLQNGTGTDLILDPEDWTAPLPSGSAEITNTTQDKVVRIHLRTPMTATWEDELEKQGVNVLTSAPGNWFVANTTNAAEDWTDNLSFVDGMEPISTDAVLDDRLADASGATHVNVVPWSKTSAGFQQVCKAVVSLDGQVVQGPSTPSTNVVDAWIDASNLTPLAENPAVSWIQPALNSTQETMANVRSVTGVEAQHGDLGDGDASGQGVKGMVVAADGVDENHPELNSSVIEYHDRYRSLGGDCNVDDIDDDDKVFDDTMEHGTMAFGALHTDGSDGFDFDGDPGDIRGMAPDASSVVVEKERLQRLPQALQESEDHGISFATYSWIYNEANEYAPLPGYTVASMESDLVVSEADISVYQSIGNDGPGHAASVGTAKNVITVGGLFHNDNRDTSDDRWLDPNRIDVDTQDSEASTGPTLDGRVKPDLIGPFNMIWTAESDKYERDSTEKRYGGTSVSTPTIAGAGAILEQLYDEGTWINGTSEATDGTPMPSLVKALLINSAETLELPVDPDQHAGEHVDPDNTRHFQGWGQPNVTTLEKNGQDVFTVNETVNMVTGSRYTVDYNVPDGTDELFVTLAWTDTPTPPTQEFLQDRGAPALVNDLDLEVESPGGTTYMGNGGLMTDAKNDPIDNDDTDAVGYTTSDADRVNNVENVFVNVSDTDTWTTTVKATGIDQDARPSTPQIDQPFALVIRPMGQPQDSDGSSGGSCCSSDFRAAQMPYAQ